MANEQNLNPPFNELTPSEHREIAKKGGKKSGKIRQERKSLRQELELLLAIADDKGTTRQIKMSTVLIQKAIKGNVKAFETVRDTLGQNPKREETKGLEPAIILYNKELAEAVEKDNPNVRIILYEGFDDKDE